MLMSMPAVIMKIVAYNSNNNNNVNTRSNDTKNSYIYIYIYGVLTYLTRLKNP